MDQSEISRVSEDLFPGSQAKRCKVHHYRNSKIFTIDLLGKSHRKIVAKAFSSHNPSHVLNEFENLSRFKRECRDLRISAPKPLYADPERGFFIMSYVKGTNLSYFLHHIKHADKDYLNMAAELSAVALAKYHSIFMQQGAGPSIDKTVREDDINCCIKENVGILQECSLNFMVKPFFDFSSWNIIMDGDAGSKLYLIDFPKTNYIFTPHLDIGRFRFGLELIKQYPPAKILGMNLWDVDTFYDMFLNRYCREMGLLPNEKDIELIRCFVRANIMRSHDLGRKDKYSWQSRLEKLYLQTFSKNWLRHDIYH
ncbi:MAG: hypothetical protein ACE14P_13565 [Methanotrichaceae archaeon]